MRRSYCCDRIRNATRALAVAAGSKHNSVPLPTTAVFLGGSTAALVHHNCGLDQSRVGIVRNFFSSSRRCSSPSPSTPLTAAEAGRTAAKLASAKLERENRLQQLLRVVDHVAEEGEDGSFDNRNTTNMATLLSHAGIQVDSKAGSGSNRSRRKENVPMSPPLHTATTYTRPADGIYKEGDSIYARMDNPTRLLLEHTVYELECSQLSMDDSIPPTTFCFSSGMQAVTAILLAHSASNTTVLIPTDVYHGVRTVLSDVFTRQGIRVRELEMVGERGVIGIEESISEIAATVTENRSGDEDDHRRTVIVWMETPSNPKCVVVDIEGVCNAVQSAAERWSNVIEVTTVVDGTMASPVLTRPIELGADISFHSGTKYLGGHSDALIGTVTVSPVTNRGRDLVPLLRSVQIAGGGVASPWDSWLTLRGMRTLHLRVERQCRTAMKLVEYLEEKQRSAEKGLATFNKVTVRAVHYPGLSSHPHHDVAKRQMTLGHDNTMDRCCFGGVFSFELANEVEATAFAGALNVAQRATSLGGTETLIEHRASIEPADCVVSPQGLLRVSVGLEDVGDLIRDFEEAFAIVEEVMQ